MNLMALFQKMLPDGLLQFVTCLIAGDCDFHIHPLPFPFPILAQASAVTTQFLTVSLNGIPSILF